ncbi:MAG: alpha amylase C-terminal domain-containing protein [Prevotellaceae bacterium]|jgi:1,4-alpha-glucan branching enzyme|nr:alpha amylase C-terminal domain-containing protein [Prevotellaceae bacterium]
MKTPALIANDAGLKPYENTICRRIEKARQAEQRLTDGKPLSEIANTYLYYGLHHTGSAWVLREWAPNAQYIYLIGDFNSWKPDSRWGFQNIGGGSWELILPPELLRHGDLYKLLVVWESGSGERIPSHCRRVVQDEKTHIFSAQVWRPQQPYRWKNAPPKRVKNPFIYEAHVGMATEEYRIGAYAEFTANVLPRIAKLGYNVLQLMAIQEHPYYGSFGYQVSSFYAPSFRFGAPEELKALVDEAHGLGIAVIMDIVHSHAVKNDNEGLSHFDGTEYQYFHAGPRGQHPVWDSRCFDYGKPEVVCFLLSNCKYWMEEFHFDGFRFDGVTSMMYLNHGVGIDFVSYGMYYDRQADEDAITYLTLANKLVHELNPAALSIAEDVSGMPGLATPIKDGGMGFDFRMSMGVADFWVKTLKTKKDEQWHVGDMFYELTNKRADEKTISYAECHDQAMVGDKTIAFWLLDKEMYTGMSVLEPNLLVDRGVALHKLIRFATVATAGDGYLSFMGNEFGHPEWIDFPREGNGWSYHYARRQWRLADDPNLRYRFLLAWDKAMVSLAKKEKIYRERPFAIVQNSGDQVLIFKRGSVLFAFNFNPVKSFTGYGFEVEPGEYKIMLCSDSQAFGGFGRIDEKISCLTTAENEKNILRLYLPSRTAMALRKLDEK